MKTFIVSLGLFAVLLGGCATTSDKADDAKDMAEEATDAAEEAADAAEDAAAKAAAAKEAAMEAGPNVLQVAAKAGTFKTLITAIRAAGLDDTLSGEGPFTVFAPTDDAFAKLPEGTVAALLEDKAKLAKILTYHVVAGKVMAADVSGMTEAKSVEGNTIAISAADGVVMLNGAATVTATDIDANNGVIHVIDTVIMPPM